MDTLLVALLGLAVGALVNWLAAGLRAERHSRRPRYLPVALATAAGMTLAYLSARDLHAMAGAESSIWLAQVALFVLIALIDIDTRQVRPAPLMAGALLATVQVLAMPRHAPTWTAMLAGALCASLFFSFAYLGGRLFARSLARRGHHREPLTAFGLGDVYLMTLGGFIVGFPDVLVAMALAVFLGGIGALSCMALQLRTGRYERHSAIPYAPYILAAITVVMLLPREAIVPLFGQ